jgi:hypothetical protein
MVIRWPKLKPEEESFTGRFYASVTAWLAWRGIPLPRLWGGNSVIDAYQSDPPSGIQVLIMNTNKIAFASRVYSLPRSGNKPTLDDKLDKVFRMAEHVDARCVYMLDRRRPGFAAR